MTEQQPMITITIDGQSLTVPKGTTVYKAASQAGIHIPIFCYQDRMPPFGACRMCLVEVEKMPKLQTSCTLEATEGMVVKTQTGMAVQGRKEILEFLLINHPLDCPICDRGGECPLQEQALTDGPGKSRFFEEKRHFKKPVPRGPVLMLDRERCIICARCTRFGDVIAGDHALELFDRGFKTEVGTPNGGPAESKFIGNTIMICPVGALTSQVYRFRARPWDNESAESTCTLCPVGCSLVLDSRDGEIMRTRSKENHAVNDIWLCDKGWFGYEFTYHPDRLTQPLIRREGELRPASWDEALDLIAIKMKEGKSGGKVAALGGNPLTFEENYYFQSLMRKGCGVNHIDHRVGMPIFSLEDEGIAPGMEMSIGECEDLSFAIFFGLDLTEEFPVIWLRLRQAINRGAQVIFIGHFAPEISPYFKNTILHPPGKELAALKEHTSAFMTLIEMGKKGALFVGQQYLASPHRKHILSEISKFKQSSPQVSLNILEGRGNSLGARIAGMRPDVGPGGEKIENPGLNAHQVIEKAASDHWEFLYVAGANPVSKFPSRLWEQARKNLGFLVVQDLFLTETAAQADVVLPALSFVEKGGTFLNIEGRLQTLMPGKKIPDFIYSDGEIFNFLADKLGIELALDFEISDLVENEARNRIPLQPQSETFDAISGEESTLRASFSHVLFDHGVRMQHNPHVSQLAKEPTIRIHPAEAKRRGIESGTVIELKANDVGMSAPVKFDTAVAEGTVVIPLGFKQIPVKEWGDGLLNGLPIDLKLLARNL